MAKRDLFEGPLASLTGAIMARANRAAEAEAIDRLDPAPDAAVLVIGYGPGVGVQLLSKRSPGLRILGVDPSPAMLAQASARNQLAVRSGQTRLVCAPADQTPSDDEAFDGAIAVNSLQMCEPIDATAKTLARVLRPGGRFVSLTHDWAGAHHAGSVQGWIDQTIAALTNAGLASARSYRGAAERGRIVVIEAARTGLK